MRLQFNVKELKGAISATDAMSKKVPKDTAAGDSTMAILRKADGFSLIAAHDYFASEIALPSTVIIGDDDEAVMSSWTGTGSIDEANLLGLAAPGELATLLGKLSRVKTVDFVLDKGQKRIGIDAGEGKEYAIMLATARKIISTFKIVSAELPVCTMSSEQFEWLCETITTLSKVVKPSAMKPGFSCVCMDASPSQGGNLRLSGSSDYDGYSVIFETIMTSASDFTALIPKNLAEAFSAFVGKLGSVDGDVEMKVTIGDDGKAAVLAFLAKDFSFTTVCSRNEFPFKSLAKIVKLAKTPYCSYIIPKDELKKAVERCAIFAVDANATTDVAVLDGGVVELVQHKALMSREKNAKESLSEGRLGDFPAQSARIATSVKTGPFKSILSVLGVPAESKMVLCKAPEGTANRLALIYDGNIADCTAVLLGIKAK